MHFNTIYHDVVSIISVMPGLLLIVFACNTVPLVYADLNWSEAATTQLSALIGLLNILFQFLVVKKALDHGGHKKPSHLSFAMRIFGAQLLYALAIVVGLLCLVLPGIYVAVRFSLCIQTMIDNDLAIWDSFHESWDLTEGRFLAIFGLALPAILLFVIAIGFPVMIEASFDALAFWTVAETLLSISIIFPWLLFSAIYNRIQNQMIENS